MFGQMLVLFPLEKKSPSTMISAWITLGKATGKVEDTGIKAPRGMAVVIFIHPPLVVMRPNGRPGSGLPQPLACKSTLRNADL